MKYLVNYRWMTDNKCLALQCIIEYRGAVDKQYAIDFVGHMINWKLLIV